MNVPIPAVIFSADDFGRCSRINRAVWEAHHEGLLTSASLMVTGDAAEEAVEMARQMPRLAVGLHLVVIQGRGALPPDQIPRLVDSRGLFSNSPFQAGLRYALSRSAHDELKRELRRQFELFAGTGLPLAHVNSHLHMHVHPLIWDVILPLAREFGARGIRLPNDELAFGLRNFGARRGYCIDWKYMRASLFDAAAFALLRVRCRRRLRAVGMTRLNIPGRTYGLVRSGRMDATYVRAALARLMRQGPPLTEIYFHPMTEGRLDDAGPNSGDLMTLVDRKLLEFVQRAIGARRLQVVRSDFQPMP